MPTERPVLGSLAGENLAKPSIAAAVSAENLSKPVGAAAIQAARRGHHRLDGLCSLLGEIASGPAPSRVRREAADGASVRVGFALALIARRRYAALLRWGIAPRLAGLLTGNEFDLPPGTLAQLCLGIGAPRDPRPVAAVMRAPVGDAQAAA